MENKKSKFDNVSTNELKKQYIKMCFGAMIYGAKTEKQRKEISDEINKRGQCLTEARYKELTED